jgi:putative transposase
MSRGVRGEPIYLDNQDRKVFVSFLAEAIARYAWRVSAYCLMDNHFHLVLRTPGANLSAGMQWLKGRYAQWFNWRHGHEGHVFYRRFHSVLVESDWHFLELVRYVLLNPVRGGICPRAADWPWSSYRTLVSEEPGLVELESTGILSYFGHDSASSRKAFAAFIRSAERL